MSGEHIQDNHLSSQALLHKPLTGAHKKYWKQGRGPEKAALGDTGIKDLSGHSHGKGTKIQPDSFLMWKKCFSKLWGKEQQNFSL